MKIVIPGGSGHLGGILARSFMARGHDVVVLSRRPAVSAWRTVPWDARTLGPWTQEIDADVVINLAGRSVDCRYTRANRHAILASRIESTRILGEAIGQAACPPRVWLQASTATIYAHRYDAPNDERTGIIGGVEPDTPSSWAFSIEVAQAWERTFAEAIVSQTRKVAMRMAMIMSPDKGGAFAALATMARLGLGGRAGDGRQFVSWVHDEDFVRALDWLIEHERLEGIINVAAPTPLSYSDFMGALRRAAHVPFGLPATKGMLEIGTFFLRTETELVLKSRRVIPGRLLEDGFRFRYPAWPEAADDLWRRRRA